MRSRSRSMLDKSVEAMLAAIEVYNKPRCAYREESFAILAVNAWELLLKARILQLDNNRIAALLEYERRQRADGTPSEMLYRKKNRSGNCVTIGLFKAYDRLTSQYGDALDPAIRVNLEALTEIRDNAVHFVNPGLDLGAAVQETGTAALKNFMNATRLWFGVDLAEFNLALMPLAFLRGIPQAEGVVLNKEERHLLQYLKSIRQFQSSPDGDFDVALRIEVQVKKTSDSTGVAYTPSKAPDAIPVQFDEEEFRRIYPWDYGILTKRLNSRYANFKQNGVYHQIRQSLEKDSRFCRERLLDPGNPKSSMKRFYNPNIVREFDKHYRRVRTSN